MWTLKNRVKYLVFPKMFGNVLARKVDDISACGLDL